ncbi:MAG: IPT/TIG domain-containing protein [Dehalococcoidales bacterium]|nr:IPT/TIG domain-containing protein [Dehalococcoidales bacterium]
MNLGKLIKKVVGLVLPAVALVSLIPVSAVAAADSYSSVTMEAPATVNPGQTFSVNINVDTDYQVRGCQFTINYDTAVLTFNSVSEGTFIKDYAGTGNTYFNPGDSSTPGIIDAFAIAQTGGPTGGATGNGTLAVMSFTVNPGATPTNSPITFAAPPASKLSDQNAVTIPGTVLVNGAANVVWPSPAITGFTPAFGGNGVNITITGTNLSSASAVTFGGIAGTIVSNTATQIVATVGAGASGSVSVENPGGTATKAGFTFVAAPTATAVDPAFGTTNTVITVTGSGFLTVPNNVQSIKVGVTPAAVVPGYSDTSVQAIVAAGTPIGVNDVEVTTYGGSATVAQAFEYFAPSGNIALTPVTQAAKPTGDMFEIQVEANLDDTAATIRGWQATINYDPEKVQYVADSVKIGNGFADFAATEGLEIYSNIDAQPGALTIAYALIGGDHGTGTYPAYDPQDVGDVLAVVTFMSVDDSSTQEQLLAGVDTILYVSNPIFVGPDGDPMANVLPGTNAVVTLIIGSCDLPIAQPADQVDQLDIPATLAPVLTFVAPWDVCCWDLQPSMNNSAMRAMTIFSNTDWKVTARGTNNGFMTKYTGTLYDTSVKLANPLKINGIILNGSDQEIATGTPFGQDYCTGGQDVNLMFTQPVLWTDPYTKDSYYKITVTFTASTINY